MTVLEPQDSALTARRTEFDALLARARAEAGRGRARTAAVFAQAAATYAWFNPIGLFASPELETLLAELGAQVPERPLPARRRSEPRTVLHVITKIYETGGSTQALSGWIRTDVGRRHLVAVTRQGATALPHKITDVLADAADLIRLDARTDDLLRRAGRLRRVAARADVVVLHVHPDDVVPTIAFAPCADVPVIYVDHADHVFWVGASGAWLVMHMRHSGRLLAERRRGLPPGRSVVAPRPLRTVERTVPREQAKAQWGLSPADIVVVTAADGSKYRAVGDEAELIELVLPVIQRHQRVHLLAAGPAAEGTWARAAGSTAGRVRALGRIPDTGLLMQAADIYLDSYPFSSLTSLLEAGAVGAAVITYAGHPASCAVLGADTPGVDEHVLRPADPEQLRAALTRMIDDPAMRHAYGMRAARAIADTHSPQRWRQEVDRLYSAAVAAGPAAPLGPPVDGVGRLDRLLPLIMEQTGFVTGPGGVLRENLGLLPARERLECAAELRRLGETPAARDLLPGMLRTRAARLKSLTTARRRA